MLRKTTRIRQIGGSMDSPLAESSPANAPRRRARLVLLAFLVTFAAARILVILIMSRRIPDLYLHLGGTHVHHLNYGIFMLAGVGGYLLFARAEKIALRFAALLYGTGLALTFDEFGMWIHLGGSYWQRASYDAVCVVAALLGLIAFAPPLAKWRSRHWAGALTTLIITAAFFALLYTSFQYADAKLSPKLIRLEQKGPI